jgi:hypothetical protein
MPFHMLHTYDSNWLHFNSAGWLGNDPLTVVIGESDPYVHITGREISHLHAATVVMTVVMIIAFLSSIAIIRRILIATPVLKVRESLDTSLISYTI